KLTFNSAPGKFFEDPEIREAVSGLIDTEAIIGAVLQGNGVQGTSPVIPALTEYQPDVQQHESDAEEVKALLADKGVTNANIVLTCDQGNANHAKGAQLVRDMLAPADINVDIKCTERAT